MARVLSVGVLATVLAPAIGDGHASAQSTGGCTTNSFTTPSWLVDNLELQRAANQTVASFNALNRATDVSLELECSSSSSPTAGGWQSCRIRNVTEHLLAAAFRADNATAWFRFSETWSCSDLTPSEPITFSAVGNSSVALDCNAEKSKTTTCRPTKPVLVKATLSSPVKVTPSYVSGPTGHDAEGCTAQSGKPAWESGNAFVIIRNDNLGYIASCGGPLTADSGPQALTCTGQVPRRRPDKYQIETALSFDPDTFVLAINQTWYCDDQDPAEPFAITGYGTTALDLQCQVFDGTGEGNTTTFCTGVTDGTFAGEATGRPAALPPYSLRDPLPTAEGCTVSSVVAPGWWLNDFVTNTTRARNDTVTARFGLERRGGVGAAAPAGSFSIVAADGVRYYYSSAADGSVDALLPWNECVLESVANAALAPTGCEFRYRMATRFLALKVQWTCNDLDAENPIAFSGELETRVPEFTCVTSGNDIRCASPNPNPWDANVTSVAWEP
ncbi:hypothetical protein MYCTH_101321 [Thermothelomyces thermophilus ATCC 42464]|uniref:AA1-like domain-containing protein n=1 Tax=Thermothelomyces thermophilus (strain ATCC 42464 / BCRC 31852 / DSM 1799) TaxID=573729 RepID=G2QD50_THET4|nr:uncharacterized protein MYCTH_101321 [Thermothelomyces thermophilus ATCC 42464]AEO58268.1 hypothetical protein MYCTH_101321 [Thermothelomyces thermophilus ATCC 42464]